MTNRNFRNSENKSAQICVLGEIADVLYVPPCMWEHQHMNDNPNSITQIRIGFGIRQWFTSIWPEGFTSTRIYDDQGNPIEAGRIVRTRERTR